jgi:hypothetical protein
VYARVGITFIEIAVAAGTFESDLTFTSIFIQRLDTNFVVETWVGVTLIDVSFTVLACVAQFTRTNYVCVTSIMNKIGIFSMKNSGKDGKYT